MTQFIRIHAPEAGQEEPHRLYAFPGRYLSEREFERLQEYVDDRIAPLLGGLPPGIVRGLEVQVESSGSLTVLHVQPGVAVGSKGRLLRLYYPLRQEWPALAELVERQQNGPLQDGIYFLTLNALVEAIDNPTDQEPCTRTEPDPLRERRLETVVLPGLQLISTNPRLLTMSKARAANRICVRFLNQSPSELAEGAVPVALVKVVNKLPEWIDTVAGRYGTEKDAAYLTLLAHSVKVLEQWIHDKGQGDPTQSLAALLGVDYLPAAGPLPPVLLGDPAGKNPKLLFQPGDLQVELAPVPASTIGAVIDRELPRGTVDLVHGLRDRIRLLLAIPDLDYRRDLMDLPERDTALEDELFHREESAAQAWKDWWLQWQLLFRGLGAEQLKLVQASVLADRPRDPADFRNDLVAQRREALGNDNLPLPEPYASHMLKPHEVTGYTKIPSPAAPPEMLYQQRDTLRKNIQDLEQNLDESFRLLNELNDYLGLQRQHLDNLTVSFSALAGGIAGDGAGSSMMRWNGSTIFDPTAAQPKKEG